MMWRLLPMMASALFAAAAIFIGFLWVRSHRTFDRVSVPLGRNRTLVAISYRGSLTAVIANITIPTTWRDSGRSHPVGTYTPDMIWPRERVLGFGWAHNELMPNIPNLRGPISKGGQKIDHFADTNGAYAAFSAVGRRHMQDGFADLVNRPACAPRLNWNGSLPSEHLEY